MSAIGDRIRAARTAAGLTLSALAQVLGVDRQTIHRWETGERDPTGLYLTAVRRWLDEHARDR